MHSPGPPGICGHVERKGVVVCVFAFVASDEPTTDVMRTCDAGGGGATDLNDRRPRRALYLCGGVRPIPHLCIATVSLSFCVAKIAFGHVRALGHRLCHDRPLYPL